MRSSDKAQQAIRRSTRLPLEVPVRISSLDAASPISVEGNTTLVNAHGCGFISPQAMERGLRVRIEIVSAQRHTAARVAEVVPLGGDPETWLVGLELDIPGNFWGIEYAPSDWKVEERVPVREPESAAASEPKPASTARKWRLTDISAGACYLESSSPFPVGTSVLVSVRSQALEFLLDGVVRVSHAQAGMGIAFVQTEEQRNRAQDLIAHLTSHRDVPRIFVGRKEGAQAAAQLTQPARDPAFPDPLLDLVLEGQALPAEQFLSDLRAQRLGKRRDPRIEISLPVLLSAVDLNGRPLDQRVMTVNISRRGALLDGIHGKLGQGDTIALTRGAHKEEFRVQWVADDASAAGARIGVAAANPNSEFWNEVLEASRDSGLESASVRGAG